jgi:hypothetical protein
MNQENNNETIWAGDLLNRREFSLSFEGFLEKMTEVQKKKRKEEEQETTIVALNAPFGSGKTYFLESWYKDLQNRNIPCAYFSAWETDFAQEPLVAFMHYMLSSFKKPQTAKDMVDNDESVRQHSLELLKLIGLSNVSDYASFLSEEKPDNSIDLFGKIIEERKQFKLALKSIIEKACEQKRGNGDTPFAFILIIDELERCKPTYAVELLEQLKHFLGGISQLNVVLGIDNEQLKHTVQHHYGQGYDAEGYLKRFFQKSVLLPRTKYSKLEDFFNDDTERISFDLLRPDLRSLIQYKTDKDLLDPKFKIQERRIQLPYDKGFIKFLLLLKSTKPSFYYKVMKRLLDESEFWEQVEVWLNRNDIYEFEQYLQTFKEYFLRIYFFTFQEEGEISVAEFSKISNLLSTIKPIKHRKHEELLPEKLEQDTQTLNILYASGLINDTQKKYQLLRAQYPSIPIRDLLNIIIEEQRWPID